MADQEAIGILTLPDEILLLTLTYLPPSTVLSLSRVSRRFYTLTVSPELWKHYCRTEFSYWDSRHEFDSKLRITGFAGWKALFVARHASSVATSSALDAIINSETNRFDHLHRILAVGYDAKDVLLDTYEHCEGLENHLAQRYWSHVALGCLNRKIAVEQWQRLDSLDEEPSNGTELSFAALDMFILGERRQGDINDILARLDFYADSIRADHPNIATTTPRERAIMISQYLLDKEWVGISDGRNYHSLDHMFLGISLFSTNHNSVPLISALTFCYVCRRLGLDAQPISYPFHVHALVRSPPGFDLDGQHLPVDFDHHSTPRSPLTHLYMDPFTSSEPVPVARLVRQIGFISPQSSQRQVNMYLSPSTRRELTIRAAHNILASPSHYHHAPLFPIPAHSASYAAWFSLAMLASAAHLGDVRQHLVNLAQHFFEFFEPDIDLFETHVLPLTEGLEDSDAFCSPIYKLRANDRATPLPKRRSPPPPPPLTLTQSKLSDTDHLDGLNATKTATSTSTNEQRSSAPANGNYSSSSSSSSSSNSTSNYDGSSWQENSIVKYRVGQVFRHRRRGYLGVIYGWDPVCSMHDAWIRMNRVDSLSLGRSQPFYDALVQDESLRYVAEENIQLLEPSEMQENLWQEFPIHVGKWFKRWDHERGVFISNVTSQYPDD